jgi:hypothetical protein
MTEIALAMAMGFFSVMILTAMSMGVGPKTAKSMIQTVAVAPNAPATSKAKGSELTARDTLVIFDGRNFLGRNMAPLDPATIDPTKRVVLAVPPSMSMDKAMAARNKFNATQFVITTLDENWRRALQDRNNAR